MVGVRWLLATKSLGSFEGAGGGRQGEPTPQAGDVCSSSSLPASGLHWVHGESGESGQAGIVSGFPLSWP